MLHIGGQATRGQRLRGRTLHRALLGLGLTAVIASGCAANPDGSDPGSPPVVPESVPVTTVDTPPTTAAPAVRASWEEAMAFCQLKIRERGLDMKLSRVEHAFDGSKLLFSYTAEHRVDFRELVRDLAAAFHMRIEMRQIGVRDEARLLGGYGPCGRPLCCATWLTAFEPVSIKMAKQQGLSLNPSKLAGVCGRLKCCLRFELPNSRGERHAGCAQEGSCSQGCGGDGACGSGSCTCGK